MSEKSDRRCFLARGIVGAASLGMAASLEERILLAAMEEGQAQPGKEPAAETPRPSPQQKPLTDIQPGSLPCGKIAGIPVSRLIIGGNLIGGWAHSRDLMYVSRLFREYNTEAKVFQTLDLAMACGVNAIQLDPACWDVISKYNRLRNPKIQTIVCVPLLEDKAKMKEVIQRQIDMDATFIYSHGGVTDNHFMHGGKIDVVAQMVDLIHSQKVPAGVGSHSLQIPMACERDKIPVDFYMKTFHMDRYWSATPKEHRKEYDWMMPNAGDHNANNDAMWCNNPEETAEFMEKVEKPWLAFKVLAAGAINPQVGFPYAFRNGADFVVAGMFDFQVEADVRIAIEAVQKATDRKRPWRG